MCYSNFWPFDRYSHKCLCSFPTNFEQAMIMYFWLVISIWILKNSNRSIKNEQRIFTLRCECTYSYPCCTKQFNINLLCDKNAKKYLPCFCLFKQQKCWLFSSSSRFRLSNEASSHSKKTTGVAATFSTLIKGEWLIDWYFV